MKNLIIFAMLFWGCNGDDKIDILHEVTEHSTRPMIIHDINTCDLDLDQIEFLWHLGEVGPNEWEGTTLDLPDEPVICNNLTDINNHLAWVRRHIKPTINKALIKAQVSPRKASIVAPMIADQVMRAHLRYYRAFLRKEYLIGDGD